MAKVIAIFNKCYENIRQYPKIWIGLGVIAVIWLIFWFPQWEVAKYGIVNAKDLADAENSRRATLAQILGGVAVGISLYYTWRRVTIAEKELKVSQEGQITERFTRAVNQLGATDQFGKPAIEIRLGGIYALERISNESEKDYWPIMEILTAYVRKNSSAEIVENKKVTHLAIDIKANESTISEDSEIGKISFDVQAVLTVLGRSLKGQKNSFFDRKSKSINLRGTQLQKADLYKAYLKGVNLEGADFSEADLEEAHLEGANLQGACLQGTYLQGAHLQEATLIEAHLEGAHLQGAHLEALENATDLSGAYLEGAYLHGANLEGADLIGANLERAFLVGANLENAYLSGAGLKGADFSGANLEGADFSEADLEGANLEGAHLEGAKNLAIEQISKVFSLYNTVLGEELEELIKPLRERSPALFDEPKCIFGDFLILSGMFKINIDSTSN